MWENLLMVGHKSYIVAWRRRLLHSSVRSQCTHMISNYCSVQVIIILGWPHALSPIRDEISGSSDHEQC
jgi:hypothetical protein